LAEKPGCAAALRIAAMANTFQFDSTTSEQVARDITNRSVGMAVAVSISDVNNAALQALPDVERSIT